MKTRHQKARLEKEGLPSTPPQQLQTATRTRRNARSTTLRSESSEPEPALTSRSATTSARGGRVSKRGQALKITKPKAAKKTKSAVRAPASALEHSVTHSDSSVQNDEASDASIGGDAQGVAMIEDVEVNEDAQRQRETPSTPVTPVVAQLVEVPRNISFQPVFVESSVTPFKGSHDDMELASATSASLGAVVTPASVSTQAGSPGSASPNRPLSATAALFKAAALRIEHQYSPECPRISLHDPPSNLSPVAIVQKAKAKDNTAGPTLQFPSGTGAPTNIAAPTEILSGLATSTGSCDETFAPKQSGTPLSTPRTELPDPSQLVYNLPKIGEQRLHTILKLCLDIKLVEHLRREEPSREPALDIAIPSSMLPDLLNFIADHPDARNSALQDLTFADPVARIVTSELTKYAAIGTIRSSQESPLDKNGVASESDSRAMMPQTPVNPQQTRTRHTLRANFGAAKARELRERQALKETNAQARGSDRQTSSERVAARIKKVTQWYDDKGNLTLGVLKEVPMKPVREDSSDEDMAKEDPESRDMRDGDEDEDMAEQDPESRDMRDEDEDEPVESAVGEPQNPAQAVTETPRSRGWRFGDFLPSAARSVSKFIPAFGRQAASTPHQNPRAQRNSATEPRQHVSVTQGRSIMAIAARGSTGRHESSKKLLLTKGEAEARRKAKKEKKWYEEQLENMKQEAARKEEIIKHLQSKAFQVARGGTETNPFGMRRPGEKRKRAPSPDAIPNPKGASYGMDLDYFAFDSDDDSPSAVSHPPSSKRKRLSASRSEDFVDPFNATPHTPLPGDTPSGEVVGNPLKARPYTGTMFAVNNTEKQHQGGNIFVGQTPSERGAVTEQTPKPQPNSFQVPSPSDSDEEYEYDQSYVGAITTPTKSSTAKLSNKPMPNHAPAQSTTPSSSPLHTKPFSPIKASQAPPSMAPPPRPIEQSSSLISTAKPSASEISLNIQRERALKYAAKTPSRLQQSSRLSTSTTASNAHDEVPAATRKESEESTSAKTTLETSQETYFSSFDSYYEYQENVPEEVTKAIETSWNDAHTETAGALFEDEFAAFVEPEQASATSAAQSKGLQQSSTTIPETTPGPKIAVSARVQAFIDNNWTDADTNIAGGKFAKELPVFEAAQNMGVQPSLAS
ncbi:MAG: hypothetical protein Q9163_004915 [Psora crenata]